MDRFERWYKLDMMLKDIKGKEAQARRELCEELFEGKTGEFKKEHETDNYIVTATSKVTRSLDKTLLEVHWDNLTDIERDCVRHVPAINLKPYRNLPDGGLLKECVTEKPAMPTMTLKVK